MSSQSNRYIQYILSVYIFPTRHMYSRKPTRLTPQKPLIGSSSSFSSSLCFVFLEVYGQPPCEPPFPIRLRDLSAIFACFK